MSAKIPGSGSYFPVSLVKAASARYNSLRILLCPLWRRYRIFPRERQHRGDLKNRRFPGGIPEEIVGNAGNSCLAKDSARVARSKDVAKRLIRWCGSRERSGEFGGMQAEAGKVQSDGNTVRRGTFQGRSSSR